MSSFYALCATIIVLVVQFFLCVRSQDQDIHSKKPLETPVEFKKKSHKFSAETFGFDVLAKAIPDMLLVIDAKNDICFMNEQARQKFSSTLMGQSFILRFRMPEFVNALRQCRQLHQGVKIGYRDKMMGECFFDVLFAPLDKDNILCSFRDATQTHALEKMRSDFIANASHELRTPLTSLIGFIETLQGPAKNDVTAREKFLNIMQDQSKRMSHLLDDLLSLSRLERQSGLDTIAPIDINDILGTVLETLTPFGRQMEVEFEFSTSSGAILVDGKRNDLIQLFENLIENACKYGKSGGKVMVTVTVLEMSVEVIVRDFGIGIASEYLPRVTERFYRINNEKTESLKGTGLGLAIVKHIVSHHQGKLAIRSNLGQGSEFIVTLPKSQQPKAGNKI